MLHNVGFKWLSNSYCLEILWHVDDVPALIILCKCRSPIIYHHLLHLKWQSNQMQVVRVIFLGIHSVDMLRDGQRSVERRVGKECVMTCRYRGSPKHKTK